MAQHPALPAAAQVRPGAPGAQAGAARAEGGATKRLPGTGLAFIGDALRPTCEGTDQPRPRHDPCAALFEGQALSIERVVEAARRQRIREGTAWIDDVAPVRPDAATVSLALPLASRLAPERPGPRCATQQGCRAAARRARPGSAAVRPGSAASMARAPQEGSASARSVRTRMLPQPKATPPGLQEVRGLPHEGSPRHADLGKDSSGPFEAWGGDKESAMRDAAGAIQECTSPEARLVRVRPKSPQLREARRGAGVRQDHAGRVDCVRCLLGFRHGAHGLLDAHGLHPAARRPA
ncbi:unnamed protein product [Prorocentrum cordatum]|uniref:C2H2-type domain-containing protein n=1 Tax=Prorocentrum cordatum TaxID=2364126 RepID=A0ABN9SFB5_9DINO|nr:unnamed protein product [Polarella glacialis]